MTCKHHWVCPASLKPFVTSACKLCGARKTLRNLWRDKDGKQRLPNPVARRWNYDVAEART